MAPRILLCLRARSTSALPAKVDILKGVRYIAEVLSYQQFEGQDCPLSEARVFHALEKSISGVLPGYGKGAEPGVL